MGQDDEVVDEIDEATLGAAIIKISKAAQALADADLNRKAVVALLYDNMGGKTPKKMITLVLDNLETLAQNYTISGGHGT